MAAGWVHSDSAQILGDLQIIMNADEIEEVVRVYEAKPPPPYLPTRAHTAHTHSTHTHTLHARTHTLHGTARHGTALRHERGRTE